MTVTVAEVITYERAIHAQARQITELHQEVERLKRQIRDLRQERLAEMPPAEREAMLYPMEGGNCG